MWAMNFKMLNVVESSDGSRTGESKYAHIS